MVSPADGQPPIRVLLAIGDAERERHLLEGLSGAGLVVAARCLDGPTLAEQAAGAGVDVALASTNLHRLTAASLLAIKEAGLPLVLLADGAEASRYSGLAHLLPRSAGPIEVAQALEAAVRSGPFYAERTAPSAVEDIGGGETGEASDEGGKPGRVIAVVGSRGAPGATTVAIALAAALADEGRRVALVDADLRGGNVGAYLDLDPRRGLFGLAYGREARPEALDGRIEDELQDGPGFAVLNGIERPEQSEQVPAELVAAAVAALRARYDEVVVDAGCLVAGLPVRETVLRGADRLLLVAGADLVALWNARSALRYLTNGLGVDSESVSVVLNRRDGREHYGPEEVEHALGMSVFATMPEDRRSARRAASEQLPLTAVGGRAAHELRRLALALTATQPVVAAKGSGRRRWLPAWRRA